jgi:dihydrofolate reductase
MICSVFVGVSVDGFMARTDGRFDFLPADGGEEHGYSAFIASVDAIVMGRGTFDVVLGFDHWPFRQPVIVLTSRACDAELPANAVLEFMSAEVFGPADRDIRLRHVETRTYSSGLVTSEYDVLRT